MIFSNRYAILKQDPEVGKCMYYKKDFYKSGRVGGKGPKYKMLRVSI